MGESAAEDMATQLADMLQAQEWSQTHGKLADIAAAAGTEPRVALQALLKVAEDASLSQDFLRTLEERVSNAPNLLKDLVLLVAGKLSMVPLGDSEPVHMIDDKNNFCHQNVENIIRCSDELSADGALCAVVSIVGAQSSGKSFLLNRLFGTRFPEMDGALRRRQTTRGIMMSRCIRPSLILLDVEGFDGSEKEGDTLFEKQASLFALTVSDLMMVNMSVTDIGREEGGAKPLFRTIFQETTKLQRGITKLLVVIRFYHGEPSIEIMRSHILEILEEIWEKVNTKAAKFKDYIEVYTIGLPDKKAIEFPQEVAALRQLIANFKIGRSVASSFDLSTSRLWETIMKNEDLHIPSHEAAVAKLFCRNTVDAVVKSFRSRKEYKDLTDEKCPGRFKQTSHQLLGIINTEYDQKTKMYDSKIRDEARKHMEQSIQEIFKGDSRKMIWKVKENTLDKFKREFHQKKIQNMGEAFADLSKTIEEFESSCEGMGEYDSDHLHMIVGELKKQLESYTSQVMKDQNERKSKDKDRYINAGINLVSGMAGNMVGPIINAGSQLYLASKVHAAKDHDRDLPSSSHDHDRDLDSTSLGEDCDLSSLFLDGGWDFSIN